MAASVGRDCIVPVALRPRSAVPPDFRPAFTEPSNHPGAFHNIHSINDKPPSTPSSFLLLFCPLKPRPRRKAMPDFPAFKPPADQEPPDGEEVRAMSLQLPAYLQRHIQADRLPSAKLVSHSPTEAQSICFFNSRNCRVFCLLRVSLLESAVLERIPL